MFATVRHRTARTKDVLSQATAPLMVCKVCDGRREELAQTEG